MNKAVQLVLVVAIMLGVAGAVSAQEAEPAGAGSDAVEIVPHDWSLQIWTLVTFALVFFLVSRYAYGPLRKVLDQREAAVRDTLTAAESARDEARKIQEANLAQVEEARQKAHEIIDEARAMTQEARHEAEEQNRRRAEEVVSQARKQIDEDVRRKTEDIQGVVASMAVRITRQFLKREMDEKQHQELVNEFLSQLKQTHEGGAKPS